MTLQTIQTAYPPAMVQAYHYAIEVLRHEFQGIATDALLAVASSYALEHWTGWSQDSTGMHTRQTMSLDPETEHQHYLHLARLYGRYRRGNTCHGTTLQ